MNAPHRFVLLSAVGILSFATSQAEAQLPQGLTGQSSRPAVRADRRPTISPYLFLTDPNTNNIAGRYFLQVQPRVEFRRNQALLGQSLSNVQREVRAIGDRQQQLIQDPASLLTPTGVTAGFMTHGRYFGGTGR